ncbi:MAG: zinc metalloprotease HtpX [Candidatus Latescibacterota bacterium]|nr:MAG: zinc metalloprotease HtpX [Candidatus Latescibacterota bacterium]
MNLLKTTLLMSAMTLLLVWVGNMLAGPRGAWLFLVIAGVMNFAAYWFSDKAVLALYRAQPVSAAHAPALHAVVQRLSERAEIPMPRLYMIPNDSPNAFATGRDPQHAAVAVTAGILRLLNQEELEGVLAHELGHVKNRDTLISSIVATMAGAITLLSRTAMWGVFLGGGGRDRGGNPIAMLLVMILAPIAAVIVQLAISRSREFAADRTGASLSGKPLALASALRKLERGAASVPFRSANEATAHQFIVNPLRGKGMSSLFSTHPSTADRVARLERMAASMSVAA